MIRIKRKRKHDPRFFLKGALVLIAAVVVSFPLMYWLRGDKIDKGKPFAVLETADEYRQLAQEYGDQFNREIPIFEVETYTYRRLDMESDEIYALLRRADDDVDGLYFDVIIRRGREIHSPAISQQRTSLRPLPRDASEIQYWPDDTQRPDLYRRNWMARWGDVLLVERSIRYQDMQSPLLESAYWLLGRQMMESHPRVEFDGAGNRRILHSMHRYEASMRKPYPDSFEMITPLALGRGGGVHDGFALTAYDVLEDPNLLMVEVARETYPTDEIYSFVENLAPGIRRYWLDKSMGYVWVYAHESRASVFTGEIEENRLLIADEYEQAPNGAWIPRRRALLEAKHDSAWRMREEIVALEVGELVASDERVDRIEQESVREAGLYENGVLISPVEPTPTPLPRPPDYLPPSTLPFQQESDPEALEALEEAPPDYGLDELTFAPYEGDAQALLDELIDRDLEMQGWSMGLSISRKDAIIGRFTQDGVMATYVQELAQRFRLDIEVLQESANRAVISRQAILPDSVAAQSAVGGGVPINELIAMQPMGMYQTNHPTLSFTPERLTVLRPGWMQMNVFPQWRVMPMRWGADLIASPPVYFGRGVTLLANRIAQVKQSRENPDIILLEAHLPLQRGPDVYRFWLDTSKGCVWLRAEHRQWHPAPPNEGSGLLNTLHIGAYDYRQIEGQWLPHWVRIETIQSAEGERLGLGQLQDIRLVEFAPLNE